MSGHCCAVRSRPRSVHDSFQRGLRTRRKPPLGWRGDTVDGLGLWASFSLETAAGRIAAARFRCAGCTTLVAYCQALTEAVAGLTPGAASRLSAEDVAGLLSGVPVRHRDRAVLALAGLRAALGAHRSPTRELREARP